MSDAIVHVVGADVRIGSHLRQRCSWCGAMLIDVDLANVAVSESPCSRGCDHGKVLVPPGDDMDCEHCNGTGIEPFSYPTYPVGRLVSVDEHEGAIGFRASYVMDETDKVPEDCCSNMPNEATA